VAHCPAKVNLSLRVLGRRHDGYHELDTLFQAIDLEDTLELREASSSLTLSCDDASVPVDESNLVLRAARLLHERHGRPRAGIAFHLRKAIPVEAGLGGGSSDAAGALLLASEHWGLDLDRRSLAGLGRELGADVPFFFTGGTARGRGRGDEITSLSPLEPGPLLLGCPPFGIPTREVYRRLARGLTLPGNGVSFPCFSAHKLAQENDFESMANGVYPGASELREARGRLHARFRNWRLLSAQAVPTGVRLGVAGEEVGGLRQGV
jgi:4-diphosphocytidyl-2-C-methyl-D-erythritol kinase